jgi:hypothetical protein
VTGKRLNVFACCALVVGCATTGPFAERCRIPNLFGTPFQDRQAVLTQIPLGTPVEQAQVVLRAHRFEQWSSQQQYGRQTLVYHVFDPAGLRAPADDIWVTVHVQQGVVVDVEVQPGARAATPAAGDR